MKCSIKTHRLVVRKVVWVMLGMTIPGMAFGVCTASAWSDETAARAEAGSEVAGSGGTAVAGEPETGKATAIARRDNSDGSRVIQVIEDDRMIRIAERPGRGITVIVLETIRDSDKVSRYAAPTVAALKAKHPRGYELFEKYANSQPMIGSDVAQEMKDRQSGEPMQRDMDATARAQMERMQREMLRRQQAGQPFFGNQGAMGGFQRSGAFRSSGAAAFGSARARASASSSSSASSRSRSSSSSGQGGQARGGR